MCIWHPFAANQVFVLADNKGISTTELLTNLADAMGIKVILLPFSPKLLSKICQLLPINASMQRLLGSLQIDSGKAKKLLGWQPRLTFEQSLKIVANDFLMKKLKSAMNYRDLVKRLFDLCAAILGLGLLLLPMALVACAIKLSSSGPIIFWSKRVGKNNIIFNIK